MSEPTRLLRCSTLLAIMAVLGTVGTVGAAEESPGVTAGIVEFGLYWLAGAEQSVPQKPVAGKAQPPVVRANVEFETQTDRIRAKKGTTFGITYRLSNLGTNSSVSLEVLWSHPPFKPPKQGEPLTQRVPIIHNSKAATRPRHLTYTLDEEYELVPGDWTGSVYYSGKLIATKVFHVIVE